MKLIRVDINVAEDGSDQSSPQIFPAMNGNRRRPPIGMGEEAVAPASSYLRETEVSEKLNHGARGNRVQPGHAGISMRSTAMNSCCGGRSRARHNLITSSTRLRSAGNVLAWV